MTTTAWKKVVETVETGPDLGDILAPLKRVYEKYAWHINRIRNKATNRPTGITENEQKGLDYYTRALKSVALLIEQ
jgi:hypothetical protein